MVKRDVRVSLLARPRRSVPYFIVAQSNARQDGAGNRDGLVVGAGHGAYDDADDGVAFEYVQAERAETNGAVAQVGDVGAESTASAGGADSAKDAFRSGDGGHLRAAIGIDEEGQNRCFAALASVFARLGGGCSHHFGDGIGHVAAVHLHARFGFVHHFRGALRGEFFGQAGRTVVEAGAVHRLGALNGLAQEIRGFALWKDFAGLVDLGPGGVRGRNGRRDGVEIDAVALGFGDDSLLHLMDGVVSGGDGRYSRGAEAHYDDDQDLHGGAATTGRGGWRRGRGLNGHLRPSALGAKARAGGEGKSAIRTEVGHGILYLGLRNRGHEQLKLFREGFEAVLEFVVEPALGARGEEAKRIALGFGGFGSVARTEIGPRERVEKERIGAVGGGDGVLGEVERFGGLEEVGLVRSEERRVGKECRSRWS